MTTEPLTVVLVDDAPEVRSLVRTQLRLSGGFTVVGEGASGLDAVTLAERTQPAVMLLDVSMPEMDGLAALPRVLAASPGTRVVLFSGFDERGLAARGRELGATGFIEKSVSLDRLVDDLRTLLAHADEPAAAPSAQVFAPAGVARAGDPEAGVSRAGDPEAGFPQVGVPHPGVSGAGAVLGEDIERFREVFEEAAIGMATMTLTGHVVRANRAMAAVLGEDVEGLVGAEYATIARAADAEGIRALVRALNEGDQELGAVEHGLTGHGTRRVAATLAVVRGRERRPLYLFLQAQDVSEQREADVRLRESEERFRLLVDAVEDYAIFMLDPRGRVASWNAGAQRIKGYRAEEVIGQHFRRFYPEERQRERHPEHELELALRDGHYEEEGWRIRKDGTSFWANVLITAVHNDSGEHVGFAKVTRDITERRRATEQRESAATALAAAKDELELLNYRLVSAAAGQAQFLAVTAHELRTPVAVLGGSADTLAKHWRQLEDDERSELFDGMVTSAARMRRLLGELLTAARLEAGAVELELQPVPVADLLDTAAAGARRANPGDEIVVDAPSDLVIRADRDRLAQAVDNLLTNALRHGAAPVRLSAAAESGTVAIRVRDAGPGVPAAIRSRLFERFATGARKGGTGLGLFIVRELARAHGGDAWYDAGEGDGDAAFVVSLPAAGRPSGGGGAAPAAGAR